MPLDIGRKAGPRFWPFEAADRSLLGLGARGEKGAQRVRPEPTCDRMDTIVVVKTEVPVNFRLKQGIPVERKS